MSIINSSQRIDDTFVNEMISILTDDMHWKEEKRYHDGTVTYSRSLPNVNQDLKAIKVVTEFDGTPEAVSYLLHDYMIERHKEWNKTFTEGKYVERFNQDENVQWWKYNQGPLVDDRDFLVARRKITQEDGGIILIDRSVIREDFPPTKDAIRCDLYFQVRLLKSLGNNRVRLSNMNMTDLKGHFPKWLLNWVNPSYSADEIFSIRDIIQSESKQA